MCNGSGGLPFQSMADKPNIKALRYRDLLQMMRQRGQPGYRAQQVFQWLYQKAVLDFSEMNNLPKGLRQELAEAYEIGTLKVVQRAVSQDGTVKFLLELSDGHRIESVLIPEGKRRTVCVSSQVGCGMGCAFCATARLGFTRNLEAWEIVEQVLVAQRHLWEVGDPRPVTNVVFMGMGEPLQNLTAVLHAIRILNSDRGPNIGGRKITVSTVGVVQGIYELAQAPAQVKLALSLHTAVQEKREQIIPLARRVGLKELKRALYAYYLQKRRWITLEYIHLPGFNDTDADIQALQRFLGDMPAKINVIPYNPFPGGPFRAPTEEEFEDFLRRLRRLPYTVTARVPRGRDIFGACGQLALHQVRLGSLKPVVYTAESGPR